MYLNSTQEKLISLNVFNNKIYFTNVLVKSSEEGLVYSMNIDGSNKTQIKAYGIYKYIVDSNYICRSCVGLESGDYWSEFESISSRKSDYDYDASELQGCLTLFPYKGDIYFSKFYGDTGIFKVVLKEKGSTTARIYQYSVYSFNIYQDKIYFTNEADESSLYRMDMNGANCIKITNEYTYKINIAGNWLFYETKTELKKLDIRKNCCYNSQKTN